MSMSETREEHGRMVPPGAGELGDRDGVSRIRVFLRRTMRGRMGEGPDPKANADV